MTWSVKLRKLQEKMNLKDLYMTTNKLSGKFLQTDKPVKRNGNATSY